jgi:hypothetical protein
MMERGSSVEGSVSHGFNEVLNEIDKRTPSGYYREIFVAVGAKITILLARQVWDHP